MIRLSKKAKLTIVAEADCNSCPFRIICSEAIEFGDANYCYVLAGYIEGEN